MLHPTMIPLANFLGLAFLLLMYWDETGALERFDQRVDDFKVPVPKWLSAVAEVIATAIGWIILTPLMLVVWAVVLLPFGIFIFGVIGHIAGVPLVLDARFYEAFAAGVLLLFFTHLIGNWPVGKNSRPDGYRWTNL